ncbi:MAG: hypothetical protein JWN50_534 [Parcubacteria group bacterium]|nr:hypothetical protein [Parcubacteria group bacterium]
MKTQHKLIIGAVVLVGIAFYGGVKYAEAKSVSAASTFAGRQTGAAGAGARGARGAFAGATAGEILTKDNESFTVKLQSGGSKIVFLGASTTVMKAVTGSVNDLVVGQTVIVSGTPNSDGSVTASSIELRQLPKAN